MPSQKLFEGFVELGIDFSKLNADLGRARSMLGGLGSGTAGGGFAAGVSAGIASGMMQGITSGSGAARNVMGQVATQGTAQGIAAGMAQGVTRGTGQARNAIGQFVAQGVTQGMAQGMAQGGGGQPRNALGQFMSTGGGGGVFGRSGLGGMAGQGLTGLGQGLGLPFATSPAMMAGQMIGSTLRDAVGTAIQMESQFIDLQRVTGKTAENVGDFKNYLFEIASKQPGAAIQDLIEISSTGAKMGITDKEGMAGLETFTSAMAKVRNVVSGIGTEQLANDTARMLNLFNKGTDYVESFGSALVRMDNVSTSSAADILDISKSLSGTFASLNMTIPQVMAFSSVISDVGLTNQQGASSFSQILRMMASQSEKFAEAIEMPVEQFQEAIRTNAMDALEMLIAKFREINAVDPIKAQEFISGLGFRGVKTAGALQQLSSMIDDVKKRTAMAVEEEETLGSLLAGTALKADTTANQILKMQNAFVELGDAIGKHLLGPISELAKGAADATRALINMTYGKGGTAAKPALGFGEVLELKALQGLDEAGLTSQREKARINELKFKQEEATAAATGMKLEAGPVTEEEKRAQRAAADPAWAKRAEESGKRMAENANEGFKSVFDIKVGDNLVTGAFDAIAGKTATDPLAMIRDPNRFWMGHPSWGQPTDAQIKGETIEPAPLFKSEMFTDPAAMASKAIETALGDKDPKIAERQLKVQEQANVILTTIANKILPPQLQTPTNTGMLIMKGSEETVTAP
jgi:TP901 family phage tail tape measure protein